MSLDVEEIGGYDYEYVVPPPDSLVCKICRFPSRDPHMTLCCGHVFCKSCVSRVESGTCATCRANKRQQYKLYKNKQVERDVWGLQIFCTNKEKGCKWQGELNNIVKGHLERGCIDGCQFEGVKCAKGCGEMVQRRHFTSHIRNECPSRIARCPHCQLDGKQMFIHGRHLEECPKLSLPCPNNCTAEKIYRNDMKRHRNQCPLQMIKCTYYSVGCTEMMTRKDQSAHDKNNLEKHLALTSQALAVQTSVNRELAVIRSEMAIIKQQLGSFLQSSHFMNTVHGGYV